MSIYPLTWEMSLNKEPSFETNVVRKRVIDIEEQLVYSPSPPKASPYQNSISSSNISGIDWDSAIRTSYRIPLFVRVLT